MKKLLPFCISIPPLARLAFLGGCLLPSYFCHGQNINITLAGQLSYGSEVLSNIWGWKSPVDGKEYALVGAENGLSIVDVSTPSAPVQIVQIPGPASQWREIRTNGNYAYVTTESGTIGLQIVDLTNLPATNLAVATWTPTISTQVLETIHALQIDNGKVYLYGSNIGNGGAIIADIVSNPMIPTYLGSYDVKYIHDGYVRNDTMYAGHIWNGEVAIVNATNPALPVLLGSFSTPGLFTHNTWLSADSKTCFTTDENDDEYLAAFDISNFGNISLLDTIQSNPGSNSIPHNTYVVNKGGIDYAVTSWYKDGLTIVDASNPSNLVQVGNYDTSPSMSGGGYGGCWGVYPFLPSGTIVASDIELGLFVLSSPLFTVGINENTSENPLVTVSPNPFQTDAVVRISNFKSQISNPEFYMYDVFGREVLLSPITDNRLLINRGNLSSGFYFYQILSEDKIISRGKLVIE